MTAEERKLALREALENAGLNAVQARVEATKIMGLADAIIAAQPRIIHYPDAEAMEGLDDV